MLPVSFRFRALPAVVCAAVLAFALAACDDNSGSDTGSTDPTPASDVSGIRDFFNAIKPAQFAVQSLQPGVSTEQDVRARLGKPEKERVFTDGSKRLEYPRGPMGDETWFVDLDSDGLFQSAAQVLTAATFAKIRPGMTTDEVRRLLGKPTEIAAYALKQETVWSWRWREQGGFNQDGFFDVHFGPDDLVASTGRSDVPTGGH